MAMVEEDVKRRELGLDEALSSVGEFGLAQKIQTALVRVYARRQRFSVSTSLSELLLLLLLRPQPSPRRRNQSPLIEMTRKSIVSFFVLTSCLPRSQCALVWASCAVQTFLFIVTSRGADSVDGSGLVVCTKSGGPECRDALASASTSFTGSHHALCALPPTSWIFRPSAIGHSIVSEFELVCTKSWLVHVPTICFLAGNIIGWVACHAASETVSRRRLLYISSIATGVAGCLSATAPSWWLYAFFRAGVGGGVGGMAMASFVLTTDLLGPTWRPYAGIFLSAGFSLGGAAVAWASWALLSWRWITALFSLVPLLLASLTWSVLVESPGWLLVRGRKGEATASLAAIAFTNKTRPPEYPLANPTALLGNPHRNMGDTLKTWRLRNRVLSCAAVWALINAVYYSLLLVIDSLENGNIVELLSAEFLYELPGALIAALLVDRIGRRRTVVIGLSLAGIFLLGAAMLRATLNEGFSMEGGDMGIEGIGEGNHVGGHHNDGHNVLSVAARTMLAMATGGLYVGSWEMLPVAVQHPGMALLNYSARLGAILAPMAWSILCTNVSSKAVSVAIIDISCCIACFGASILIFLGLPETLGAPVHDTIQEMNAAAFKRHHRSWTHSWAASAFRPLPAVPHSPGVAHSSGVTYIPVVSIGIGGSTSATEKAGTSQ